MAHKRPARPTARRIRVRRIGVAGLFVVLPAIVAARGYQLPASSRASASSSTSARGEPPLSSSTSTPPEDPPRHQSDAVLGQADGAVPAGTTIFDDSVPGVTHLDPDLLGALRRAATAAAGSKVTFVVDSGWRSPDYQEQLLQKAVSKYGSEEEAARWVATPDTSAHVSGDAVDIGPAGATWLSKHGAGYGVCPIYRNEPWHYELRPDAIAHGCPAMYADPTHDPRMQS